MWKKDIKQKVSICGGSSLLHSSILFWHLLLIALFLDLLLFKYFEHSLLLLFSSTFSEKNLRLRRCYISGYLLTCCCCCCLWDGRLSCWHTPPPNVPTWQPPPPPLPPPPPPRNEDVNKKNNEVIVYPPKMYLRKVIKIWSTWVKVKAGIIYLSKTTKYCYFVTYHHHC